MREVDVKLELEVPDTRADSWLGTVVHALMRLIGKRWPAVRIKSVSAVDVAEGREL